MNYKSLLLFVIFFVLNSCQSQEKKNINKKQEVQNIYPTSIKCYLVSLDGEQEIYQIKNDSIYTFGKTERLSEDEYKKYINNPAIIYDKGAKYGCGICTDEVDYKFVFNYRDKQTIWEMEPSYELPIEVNEYFNLLILRYKEFINK